ncbi:methyl-accepting chemotaxis protein [Kineothrix sedimenti]|uniref:Methyl-accepting chemotaxis protein n=1 Tax=Kineothrix sedimenti TaxID=3123317 RepID=A0ABZ3F105_9FIRM
MNSEEKMEVFQELLLIMKEVLQEELDIALYLTDTEKCIEYYPGKTVDAKVRRGDLIRPDEPIYDVIHNRKTMNDIVPKEVFGVTFRGIGRPIIDNNGEVIGALAVARNIENELLLSEASESMFSALEEISASIQEISANTHVFSEHLTGIEELSDMTKNAINEAGSVINSIQSISKQSNLLALNAAIEAARAGTAGRGFSVVAEEMRKLSEHSNDSAAKVANMLNEMKEFIVKISDEITGITESYKGQVEITSQITVAIEEVTGSSEKLVELSQN